MPSGTNGNGNGTGLHGPEVTETTGSWLCQDPLERERLLDMDKRLRPMRAAAFGIIFAVLAASVPWMGWDVLVPLVVAVAGFGVCDRLAARSTRPEYWIAAAWVLSQLAIATTAVISGAAESPMIFCLIIPAITLPARFNTRGVLLGAAITAALMAIVALGFDWDAVVREPPLLMLPVGTLAATMVLSLALRSSDVEHRADAVLDQLTGMLNRKALASRTQELTEQSRITGQPVGVVMADIDHFKRINDEHGHQCGDEVLQEVAYRIRKELRAYDLAYRLGGEEFAVLLPGADIREAEMIAERLRLAISINPIAGRDVRMSFGVYATGGHDIDFADLLGKADAALYRAKRSGRDRVRVWDRASDPAVALRV